MKPLMLWTSKMKNIFEYIKNLKNKKTIIIVSHNLNNLKICDSIYNITNKSLEKNETNAF